MNRIFAIKKGFPIPDGTIVYPFLNPKDSESGLPWDLIEGFSLAAGVIAPHTESKIQVLPLAAQVTFVLDGKLDIRIKDTESREPYTLSLSAQQAAVKRAGTFFQLDNSTDVMCRVLYIVSPPYVFDKEDDHILYDDAIVFNDDWQAIADANWQPSTLRSPGVTPEARRAALDRLERRSR
jgi:hypothetical protein